MTVVRLQGPWGNERAGGRHCAGRVNRAASNPRAAQDFGHAYPGDEGRHGKPS